jgi:hypothetical protein
LYLVLGGEGDKKPVHNLPNRLADSQIGQVGFPMLAGRPSRWTSTKPAKAGFGIWPGRFLWSKSNQFVFKSVFDLYLA